MLISKVVEQISLENGEEVENLKDSSLETSRSILDSTSKGMIEKEEFPVLLIQKEIAVESSGDDLKASLMRTLNRNSEERTKFEDLVNLVREREKEELEQTISTLEEEVSCLKQRHKSFLDKRREALNKILDLKGAIRVFCRVRPFCPSDKRTNHQPIVVESEKIVVRSGGSTKGFGFDKVFDAQSTQEHVYGEVEPILRSVLDGCNVCIFAYGQSGTGKTFTMDGTNESPGILPRALEELFRQKSTDVNSSISFSISMLEVYLGSLRDLLAQKPSRRVYAVSKCNLNIQTDTNGSVEIDGLTEVEVSNLTKARWWYTKGKRSRSTSWTNVNESSSRSHCLTRITMYRPSDKFGDKSEISKLWLVDLGGSERLLKTGATGQTLDEGRAINLSLSALGDVIAALRRKKGHVPYRNSKLTQILRDSLGDRSKVLMLVHVSPSEEDVGETTFSCTFAKRARAVESVKELTEDALKQKENKIAEIESELKEVEEECSKVKTKIQKVEIALTENNRLLKIHDQLLEDENISPPSSPVKNDDNNNNKKSQLRTRPIGRPIKRVKDNNSNNTNTNNINNSSNNSMPRFMYPTVASLERRSASEREIDCRIKNVRPGTRSSMQTSASQSLSYPDSRFKALLKITNRKSRYSESTTNDDLVSRPVATVMQPIKIFTAGSDSNSKVPIIRHRRRMSDLV